jgi:hypothetical protein
MILIVNLKRAAGPGLFLLAYRSREVLRGRGALVGAGSPSRTETLKPVSMGFVLRIKMPPCWIGFRLSMAAASRISFLRVAVQEAGLHSFRNVCSVETGDNGQER